MNSHPTIYTLDLNYQNCRQAIASYLIPHPHGLILIESGPGSTQETLIDNINQLGFDSQQITHVLLTHIHLDHAGAAGWLAKQTGAQIYVHPRGAPHMIDPSKLLASATRIYQDQMSTLWGDFLPVPEDQLVVPEDGEEIQIGPYVLRALDTPGHANHHFAYLLDDICFSGDVGGVRISSSETKILRIPMPPPEFHPPRWRESISKLKSETITRIAPTHFGFYEDVEWHLDQILTELDAAEKWMEKVMPHNPELDDLREQFVCWVKSRAKELGLSDHTLDSFEKANPSGMSADGIYRYWHKYRSQG